MTFFKILLICFCCSCLHAKMVLIHSYHLKRPFIMSREDRTGLTYDFVRLLGKYSNDVRYRLEVIPKKRIDGLSNKIVLWTNPKWVKDEAQYQWITTHLQDADVVIYKKNLASKYKDFTSMYGEKLLCVRGYYYANLEKLFIEGKISRANVNSEDQIMKVIARDRYKFGIISLSAFNYKKRTEKIYDELTYSKNHQDDFMRYIQVSKTKKDIVEDLLSISKNKAFLKELEVLFNNYGLDISK